AMPPCWRRSSLAHSPVGEPMLVRRVLWQERPGCHWPRGVLAAWRTWVLRSALSLVSMLVHLTFCADLRLGVKLIGAAWWGSLTGSSKCLPAPGRALGCCATWGCCCLI